LPQSTHDRGAELHNLASHAHIAAATAHGKGDHLSAHELSRQAHERAQIFGTARQRSNKVRQSLGTPKTRHIIHFLLNTSSVT
jgi:hypothetical protein